MIEGKKVSALLFKSWKKSFDSGINMPAKKRFCNECNVKKMCKNIVIKSMKVRNSKLI